MADLPGGTVTFLLTDVEGSTRRWEDDRSAMSAAVTSLDALVERHVSACHGFVVKPRGEGDAHFCVFARATDAVCAAVAVQRELVASDGLPLRIAIHTGEAELRDADYYGPTVNRAARLRAIGYGGQTLLSGSAAELVELAPGWRLRELGMHHLKDLDQPERVLQLDIEGLPSDFPPLKSLEVVRHNLPPQPTSFIGRDAQLADVEQLVMKSSLVTLTGVGGTGKTRLATEAALRVAGEFPDGAWFIDLAPLNDPVLVVPAIAAELGLRAGDQGTGLLDRMCNALRDSRMLLVLDNCEHLITEVADVVTTLRKHCGRLSILATSREALALPGEALIQVPSLELETEAVQLFVERASLRRAYELSESDRPYVLEICRRLDGIPLAIELAAGKTRMLSAKQIAAKLDDRFALLSGGTRGARGRQQTLEATIDWSYDLLSEPERATFRRLAAFAGGFDIEAVEGVVPDGLLTADVVLDCFEQLIDKSLLTVEVNEAGDARYRLLETVRQYAAVKLGLEDDLSELLDRHQQHFADFAERASNHLFGPDERYWTTRVLDEAENLRAAAGWRGDARTALRLLALIGRPLVSRVPAGMAELLSAALRDAPDAPNNDRIRVHLTRWDLSGIPQAGSPDPDLEAAIRIAGSDPTVDPDTLARLAMEQAWLAMSLGDAEAIDGFCEQALRHARADRTGRVFPGVASSTADFYGADGRYDEAEVLVEEALSVARRIGSSRLVAFAEESLARHAYGKGAIRDGQRYLDRAREHTDLTNLILVARLSSEESKFAVARRDGATALEAAREAVRAASRLGEEALEQTCRPSLVRASIAAGDLDEARSQAEDLLRRADAAGGAVWLTSARVTLAEVAVAGGDLGSAERELRAALEFWSATGQPPGDIARALAEVEVAKGAVLPAARRLRDVTPRLFGDKLNWVRATSRVASAAGNVGAAARLYGATASHRRLTAECDSLDGQLESNLLGVAATQFDAGRALTLDDAVAEGREVLEQLLPE